MYYNIFNCHGQNHYWVLFSCICLEAHLNVFKENFVSGVLDFLLQFVRGALLNFNEMYALAVSNIVKSQVPKIQTPHSKLSVHKKGPQFNM